MIRAHLNSLLLHLVVSRAANIRSLIDRDIQDFVRLLRSEGIDLRIVRNLGAGGNGLVTLLELQHGATAPSKKFVMKTSLNSSYGMRLEKYYMLVRTNFQDQ